MANFSIDIQNLVKYHGGTLAVDNLSLTVRRGEFFSILGPSGSGKTSFLRLLGGFEEPDGGEILIEGRSMRGVPPHLRPVNLVFQSYALFPHLTVHDNIAFGLEMRGLSKGDIHARVQAVLAMVRLYGKSARLPSQLSGGEQQRVALARALVNQPAVLLLDEPLGALDQQLRQDMQVELKAIQEQVGLTFLCVTHHQEEALTMSDRLAVMHQGRLLQIGSPQEIYEDPATPFVAQFVGTSNQMTASLESVDGSYGVALGDLPRSPRLRVTSPEGVSAGRRVIVILRPERVHISREHSEKGFDNSLPAHVQKAIYTGSEMHYLVQLSDRLSWKARVANSSSDEKHLQVGEAVFLSWNADEAKVLLA